MDAAGDRFANLEALELAHVQLLDDFDRACAGETVVSDSASERSFVEANRERIVAFLARGARTGAVLHGLAERRPAQQILDRWAACLFRVGIKDVPPAGLAPFDENAAPDLADVKCPYVGLEPFREDEAPTFFGRDERTRDLVEAVRTRTFVFVTGASGSGKSSLVLAGLLPALHADAIPGSAQWVIVPTVLPGSDPLTNLAQQLAAALPGTSAAALRDELRADPSRLRAILDAHAATPCLVVVDQFEEVFTLKTPETESDANTFVTALIALADSPSCPHRVVATFRKDREGDLAASARLQQIYFDRPFIVSSMLPEQLRAAIERPAAQAGLVIEPDVVETLVNTFTADETGLPLLQYCLVELWQRRTRNRVNRRTLAELGDPKHAMAKVADALYEAMSVQGQAATKLVFLQLARKVEGQEFLRARRTRRELWSEVGNSDTADDVIRRFAERRLLRVSPAPGGAPADDTIEVAHEALLRNWNEFRRWVVEEGSKLDQRMFVSRQAAAWAGSAAKRDPAAAQDGTGLLLSGLALQQAMKDIYPTLAEGSVERRFLDESRRKETYIQGELTRAAEAARNEARWAGEREQRKARTLRRLGLVTIVVAALSVALTYVWYQSRERGKELLARQLGAAARAACDTDPELARRLAQRAFEVGLRDHPAAVHDAVAASLCVVRAPATRYRMTRVGAGDTATAFALAPDGRVVIVGDATGALQEWNIAEDVARPESDPLDGDSDAARQMTVATLAYNPDATLLVAGKARTAAPGVGESGYACKGSQSCGELAIFARGAPGGAALTRLVAATTGPVTHVAFSRDGSRLAVAELAPAPDRPNAGTLSIYDIAAIRTQAALPPPLFRKAVDTGVARLAPGSAGDAFLLVTRTNRATALQAKAGAYEESRLRIPECATPSSVSAGVGRQLVAQASRVCVFTTAPAPQASVRDEGNVLAAMLRGDDDVLIALSTNPTQGADVVVRHLGDDGDVVVLRKAFDADALDCDDVGGTCANVDALLQASRDGKTIAVKPARASLDIYRLAPRSQALAWLRRGGDNVAFSADDRYFGVLERGVDTPARRTLVYSAFEAKTGRLAWRAEIEDDEPTLPLLRMIDGGGERFVVQGERNYAVWHAGPAVTRELAVPAQEAMLYPLPAVDAFALLRRGAYGAGTACELYRLAVPARPAWTSTGSFDACEFYADGSVAVVSTAEDGTRTIVVQGTAAGAPRAQLAGLPQAAQYFTAGAAAKHLLVAVPGGDGTQSRVSVYALRDGALAKTGEYDGPTPLVTLDSPRAFTVDDARGVFVVSEGEGRLTQRPLDRPEEGSAVPARALDVSGRHGVAVSDGRTAIVSVDDTKASIPVEANARVEFAPGGGLALATRGNRAVILDLATRAALADLPFPVQEAHFSTGGTYLVARTADGTYMLPLAVPALARMIAGDGGASAFTDEERCRYENDDAACARHAKRARAAAAPR